MCSQAFAVPPRASPRPLESWLRQSDRSEHVREPFFSGRTVELGRFQSSAHALAEGTVGGESIIFQGAPGAGKTALMLECMEAVRRHSTAAEPWAAVRLEPDMLASAEDTVEAISKSVSKERARHSNVVATKVGGALRSALQSVSERGGGLAGVQVGGKTTQPIVRTAARLFGEAAARWSGVRIVVFVDEAQNIPVGEGSRATVDRLHRGAEDMELLTVFLGLGDTHIVLGRCGISRPAQGRLIEMGPLTFDETRASLGAAFAAYGFGEPGPARAQWINRLAEESQGWPQHLNRMAVAAGRAIARNALRLDDKSLQAALAAGREMREEYYESRLGRAMKCPGLYKRLALEAETGDGSLSQAKIGALAAPTLRQLRATLDAFLAESLRAGILAPTSPGAYAYRMPIPSLGRFLRELPVRATPAA